MHNWGDKNVDWAGINDAAYYIGRNLKRWGRVNVSDMKEKYGTVRVYVMFGWYQMFSITHPGYAHNRYPRWLWNLDCLCISKIMPYINYLVVPYHKWLYTYMYGRALKKWPHLRLEILQGADCSELLSRYGVHSVKTGPNSYDILYDWHKDNFNYKKEDLSNEQSLQPIEASKD